MSAAVDFQLAKPTFFAWLAPINRARGPAKNTQPWLAIRRHAEAKWHEDFADRRSVSDRDDFVASVFLAVAERFPRDGIIESSELQPGHKRVVGYAKRVSKNMLADAANSVRRCADDRGIQPGIITWADDCEPLLDDDELDGPVDEGEHVWTGVVLSAEDLSASAELCYQPYGLTEDEMIEAIDDRRAIADLDQLLGRSGPVEKIDTPNVDFPARRLSEWTSLLGGRVRKRSPSSK